MPVASWFLSVPQVCPVVAWSVVSDAVLSACRLRRNGERQGLSFCVASANGNVPLTRIHSGAASFLYSHPNRATGYESLPHEQGLPFCDGKKYHSFMPPCWDLVSDYGVHHNFYSSARMVILTIHRPQRTSVSSLTLFSRFPVTVW